MYTIYYTDIPKSLIERLKLYSNKGQIKIEKLSVSKHKIAIKVKLKNATILALFMSQDDYDKSKVAELEDNRIHVVSSVEDVDNICANILNLEKEEDEPVLNVVQRQPYSELDYHSDLNQQRGTQQVPIQYDIYPSTNAVVPVGLTEVTHEVLNKYEVDGEYAYPTNMSEAIIRIDELREVNKSLFSERNDFKSRYSELVEKATKLKTGVTRINDMLSEEQLRNRDLQDRLQEREMTITNLNNDLASKEQMMRNLSNSLTSLESKNRELTVEVSKLSKVASERADTESKLKATENMLDEEQEKSNRLEGELLNSKLDIKNLKENIDKLNIELKSREEVSVIKGEKILALEDKISSLRKSISSLEETNQELEAKNKVLSEENSKKEQLNKDLNALLGTQDSEKIKEYEQKIIRYEQKVIEYETKMKELELSSRKPEIIDEESNELSDEPKVLETIQVPSKPLVFIALGSNVALHAYYRLLSEMLHDSNLIDLGTESVLDEFVEFTGVIRNVNKWLNGVHPTLNEVNCETKLTNIGKVASSFPTGINKNAYRNADWSNLLSKLPSNENTIINLGSITDNDVLNVLYRLTSARGTQSRVLIFLGDNPFSARSTIVNLRGTALDKGSISLLGLEGVNYGNGIQADEVI